MKKLAVLFLIEFIVGFVAAPAMAAGKSKVGHLYLYEKDPSTWEIIDGGAWGKMKYNLAGPEFEFTFTGRRLRPGTTYMLIVYPNSGHTALLVVLQMDVAKLILQDQQSLTGI